jgi:hypothetical protein
MTLTKKDLEQIRTIVEDVVREVITLQFAPPMTREHVQLISPKYRQHATEIYHIILKYLKVEDGLKRSSLMTAAFKKAGIIASTTNRYDIKFHDDLFWHLLELSRNEDDEDED